MPPSGAATLQWELADGEKHNFSPASLRHAPGLYIASAPGSELPGWGTGEVDLGLRMMSLTSWLDLLLKCKIKHVVCLMEAEELEKRYSGLGDGTLAATCRSQGLSFRHVQVPEGAWPLPAAAAEALAALKTLPAPLRDESAVLVCTTGQGPSATVAAAWLHLLSDLDAEAAAQAVEQSATEVAASRKPLDAFEGNIEAFEDFVSAALGLVEA